METAMTISSTSCSSAGRCEAHKTTSALHGKFILLSASKCYIYDTQGENIYIHLNVLCILYSSYNREREREKCFI